MKIEIIRAKLDMQTPRECVMAVRIRIERDTNIAEPEKVERQTAAAIERTVRLQKERAAAAGHFKSKNVNGEIGDLNFERRGCRDSKMRLASGIELQRECPLHRQHAADDARRRIRVVTTDAQIQINRDAITVNARVTAQSERNAKNIC